MKRIITILWLAMPLLMTGQINVDSLLKKHSTVEAIDLVLKESESAFRSNPRLSMALSRKALELARKSELYPQGIEAATTLGRAYTSIAQYDSALTFFFMAEGFCQRTGDDKEMAAINANIAAAYTYLKDYKRALRYYSEAQKSDDLPLRRRVFHNRASLYLDQEEYEKALEFFERSLEISEERGDSSEMGYTMNMLGETYRQTLRFEEAEESFQGALAIFEPKGDLFGRVIVMNNMGTLYLDQKKLPEALAIYQNAVEVNKSLGNLEATATLLTNIGVIYRQRDQYDKALEYYQQALDISVKNNYIMRRLKCMAEIHETLGLQKKYTQAYKLQTELVALEDSIDSRMANDRMIKYQMRVENKEKENEFLRQEKEIQELSLGRQRMGLVFIAFALLVVGLLGFLLFSRYRLSRKHNRSLEKSNVWIQQQNEQITANNSRLSRANQELKEFAYIVSHDLKEPLRMIGSYVTLLRRRYFDQLDDDGKEFIEFTVSGVKRMKVLLDDLLRYMVVETDDYSPEDVDLNEVIRSVNANLLNRIEESNAVIEIDPLPQFHSNRGLLVLLFQNLISNAVKFRGEANPLIKVKAEEETEGRYLFSISDNGIGIPAKYQDRIFSIFYRVNGRYEYEGTGIGLSICQKIVALHGGKIWVESEEGVGTTFYFTLGNMKPPVAKALDSEATQNLPAI